MAIPARQPSRHHGFTLIEAMITIAVLVILVTLAAPAFNLAEQRRVVGAAESALDQIQTARGEAIKQGRDIYFVSQVAGTDWCLGISEDPGCDCTVADVNAAGACKIKIAESGGPNDDGVVVRTTQSTDFRNISMTGGQEELRFDHVRATVAGNRRALEFSSAPNNFEMRVNINPIGRPSACGPNRAMGAYSQCD